MLDEFNKVEFGKRLKGLRGKRFKDFPRRFFYCESQESFMKQFALGGDEGKGCRQTLASWEKGETVPTIPGLYQLCGLLDCTPEYLLGRDSKVDKDMDWIAKTIHLDIKGITEIRENKDVSQLLDFLLRNNDFLELCAYIRRETVHRYLEVELMGHFDIGLKRKMERAFDRAFAQATPFDELSELYKRELKKCLSPDFLFDAQSGQAKYVSKDVLNNIEYEAEGKGILPQTDDYYNLVIDALADFSIQSLSYRKEAEQTVGRIAQMFIGIVESYIQDKRHTIRKDIKQYAGKAVRQSKKK